MDLIDRQAAIDMLKNRWKKTRHYEGIGDDIAEECELYLKQVPSAQPEKRTEERTETHACDCISRRAAIDATWFEPSYTDPLNVLTEVRDRLKELPSAQPKSYREGYQAGYKAGQRDAQAHTEEEP